jgi:hypothetical protein
VRTLEEIVIDWMSRKGPAEWHGVAAHWNWDEGAVPLLWILDQPMCDRATALTIFWDGECYRQIDTRHSGYAPGREEHKIAERVVANWPQYTTSRFKFRLPFYVQQIHMPSYGLSPEGLARLQWFLVNIAGHERYPVYDSGVPAECRIEYLELNGEPVSDLNRQLLAEEQAGKHLSQTDAEVAARHQQDLQESLSDLEDLLSEVERIRRGKI